jgi:hypothetical protein
MEGIMKKIITFSVLIVGLLAGFLGCSNNVDSTKFIQDAVLVQEIQRNITHELTQEEIDDWKSWAKGEWTYKSYYVNIAIYTKTDNSTIDITSQENNTIQEYHKTNPVSNLTVNSSNELTVYSDGTTKMHYEVNDNKSILKKVVECTLQITTPFAIEGTTYSDGSCYEKFTITYSR